MTEASSDLAAAEERFAELERRYAAVVEAGQRRGERIAELEAMAAQLTAERDAALAVITAGCQIAQAVAPVIQEYATAVDRFMKDQT